MYDQSKRAVILCVRSNYPPLRNATMRLPIILAWCRYLSPSLNVVSPRCGTQVVYMDTEGNFRPERIEAIAERFGLDPNETLENIIVTRVFNHEQQIERAHVRRRPQYPNTALNYSSACGGIIG